MTNEVSVTLTYRQQGTRPPLFVAGTFTEPPWTPQEMDYAADESGEMAFSKTCVLRPGVDIQYKFRVGMGDWWVLDEGSPTAKDPQGNVNNVARVPSLASGLQDPPETENDADGGRPTFEGGGNLSIKDGSTTNLLGDPGMGGPTYGANLEQAAPSHPNDDVEGAHGQSELSRRNGPRSPVAADGSTPAMPRKQGWIVRIFRRVWAGIGALFRRLFRKNAA